MVSPTNSARREWPAKTAGVGRNYHVRNPDLAGEPVCARIELHGSGLNAHTGYPLADRLLAALRKFTAEFL